MHDRTVKSLSSLHTLLFRATRGLIGSRLANNDMLLLTTTGRQSGNEHTIPLIYLNDGDDFIVIASYGGRPSDPDWYCNLISDPSAKVSVGGDEVSVAASTMGDEERSVWWPRIVDAYGDYETYQARTSRTIPVVRLRATNS